MQPFPTDFFINSFTEVKGKVEQMPIFQIPIGFNMYSLFNIARYYDGTGISIYNHKALNKNDIDFSKTSFIDFSDNFESIIKIELSEITPSQVNIMNFLSNYTDRMFDTSIISKYYATYEVQVGYEPGIAHYLSGTRQLDKPIVFLLNDTDYLDVPTGVITTSGQPYLMNSLIKEKFSTESSVAAKHDQIKSIVARLKNGQFQINWAIVTKNGKFSLILCRHPSYFEITNKATRKFKNFEDATKDSNFKVICYEHTFYQSKVNYEITKEDPELPPFVPSDMIYCTYLFDQIKEWKSTKYSLKEFMVNSIHYSAFFLAKSGFDEDICVAASFFIEYPDVAASISYKLLKGIQEDNVKLALDMYKRFSTWIRCLNRSLKGMEKGDLEYIQSGFLGCFLSLPARNHYITSISIIIAIEAMKVFHKQRGQNDKFYFSMLKIFRFLLGDQFDIILGIPKYDVPRNLRLQVVSVDTCVKQFYLPTFYSKTKSPRKISDKFLSYLNSFEEKNGQINNDDEASFAIEKVFIEFLKLQTLELSIVI